MSANIEKIKAIKRKHEKQWLEIKTVVAVGIGKTSDGKTGIIVSVKENTEAIKSQLPTEIEGVRVEIQETGEIKAF